MALRGVKRVGEVLVVLPSKALLANHVTTLPPGQHIMSGCTRNKAVVA